MEGLAWLEIEDACDLLRVGLWNARIIEQQATVLPFYVEEQTGYPADDAASLECDPIVQQLCRFILELWFNPDGTDATQLRKVVDSLTMAVRAMVIYRKTE